MHNVLFKNDQNETFTDGCIKHYLCFIMYFHLHDSLEKLKSL